QFIEMTAAKLGLAIEWRGKGVEEEGRISAIRSDKAPALKVGDIVVRIDPRYFRPAEVETLLGDPTKAKQKRGWTPKITLDEMIDEMVAHDLDRARQKALLKSSGFKVSVSRE